MFTPGTSHPRRTHPYNCHGQPTHYSVIDSRAKGAGMTWLQRFLRYALVDSHPRNRFCLWCGRAVAAEVAHRLPHGVYCDETHADKDRLSRGPH
jgi:hypothetical protein